MSMDNEVDNLLVATVPRYTTSSGALSVFTLEVYFQTASAPSAPTAGSGTYNFSTDTFTNTGMTSWSRTLPASSTTPTYRTGFTFSTATPSVAVAGGTWSAPVVIAQNGAGGGTGPRGAGTYYATGSAWVDATAAAACPGGPILNDTVTISNGTNFIQTKFYNGSGWTNLTSLIDGTRVAPGTITNGMLAGAIDATKFASSIEPNTIVSSVPGTKSTNNIFNTTDGKLYQWNGSSYVTGVAAADISGTIADTKIAALSASKITGTLVASQVALSIGGGNLVNNSSLEAYSLATLVPTWYGQYNNASIATSILRITGRQRGFAYGLRANATGASTFGLVGGAAVKGGWLPNTTYVFSFYAKKVAGASWTTCGLRWNTQPATTVDVLNPTLTTSWQRYAFRITTGATVEGTGNFYIDRNGATAINDEFHIDDIQVEQGDTLTAYAPAVDEILPGTITATEVADDAITTPKLFTGAVVAGKIAAGAITAEKMAVGTGKNLVRFSTFTMGTLGWETSANNTGYSLNVGYNLNGYTFGETSFLNFVSGTPANATYTIFRQVEKIPVVTGNFYEMSVYLNTHRCSGQVVVQWNDAAGAMIGAYSYGNAVVNINTLANALSLYVRSVLIMQAPVGAVTAQIGVYTGYSAQSNPHTFATRMFFAEATQYQTTASPWSASGVTQIDGGQITTNSITANQIAADTITGNKLAANTITAKNLILYNNDSVDPDPGFYDPTYWWPSGAGSWPANVGPLENAVSYPISRVLLFLPGANVFMQSRQFVIERGAQYRVKVCIFKNSGTTGAFSPVVHIPGVAYHPLNIPRLGTAATAYGYNIDWAAIPNDTWTTYESVINTGTQDWYQHIFAGSITAGALYIAIQITLMTGAKLIVDGSIIAGKLAVDAVTAGTINAGAVSARELAVGAVTAEKILVQGRGAALNADPNCQDISAWPTAAGVTFTTVSNGAAGPNVMRSGVAITTTVVESASIPISAGKSYRATCKIRGSGTGRTAYFRVRRFNSGGTQLAYDINYEGQPVPNGPGWTQWEATFQAESTAISCSIQFDLNWTSYDGVSFVEVQDVRLEEVLPGTLIQNGAITTPKISVGAITAASGIIANLAVDTLQIAGNAVTVPYSISLGGLNAYYTVANLSPFVILTAPYTPTGRPILISTSFILEFSGINQNDLINMCVYIGIDRIPLGGDPSSYTDLHAIRLGSTLGTYPVIQNGNSFVYGGGSFIDTPAAGSYYYRFKVCWNGAGTPSGGLSAIIRQPIMTLMEVKK